MILIVGGAGYIGSHVNKELNKHGYETVVYDNLIYGHKEAVKWGTFEYGDLRDTSRLEQIFNTYDIEAVFHFAAFAYVGESVTNPSKYYNNNVSATINLLDVMVRHNVKYFVFSSTCATYGQPEQMPITEDMPQRPINPYGASKLMVERILEDYENAYGLHSVCLRYFNAAGDDPDGEIGEMHDPETHIIPLVLDAAIGKRDCIKVFGTDYETPDGSCVRDYIHVLDLADAHIRALEYMKKENCSNRFNLGTSNGTSVIELVDVAKKVTGVDFKVVFDERRPGDPATLIGGNKKAMEILGWEARHSDIETILKDAWNWHRKMEF
jgi:UDP-glucose 4-epimerase